MRFIDNKTFLLLSVVILTVASTLVYSHCQIPCGIYDDHARFKMIAEHITTIEKSITSINKLSRNKNSNLNQIVRWINNKEKHADDAAEIITYYFMAQRLKPVADKNSKEFDNYIRQLTLLHRLLLQCTKVKQSTNYAVTGTMRTLLADFQKEYYSDTK